MKKLYFIFLLLFIILAPLSTPQNNSELKEVGLIFFPPELDPYSSQVVEVFPLIKIREYSPLQNSIDLTQYLPPVDSQGSQGSCVGWAAGYYYKSWQENFEANRTSPSERNNPENICSPAYIYNIIHVQNDNGAYFSDAFRVINDFGCSSWEEMPYYDYDYTTWPSEQAYENAIKNRTQTTNGSAYYYIKMDSDEALNQVKQLLLNGEIVIFGISVYSNYDYISNYDNMYCIADKYGNNRGGHAQTIVGFDDNINTHDGVGAFRVVNSWGSGWGDGGFYWISYEAIKYGSDLSHGYAYWVDDKIGYDSNKKVYFKFSHQYSRETDTWLSVGGATKYFFDFSVKYYSNREYLSFPSSNIVLDVNDLSSYLTEGAELRINMSDILSNGAGGSIDYFKYIDTGNGYSVEASGAPANVPDGGSNFLSVLILGCSGPSVPENPSPANGEVNVSVTTNLDWGDCTGATSYDVYFGTSPPSFYMNTSESYCNLSMLGSGSTYYWKIIAKNDCGETSSPEWDFTTESGISQCTLTISSSSGGTTDPAAGIHFYYAGSSSETEAIPNSGYAFSHWTGDVPQGHESDNPLTIIMDSDKSLQAHFEAKTWGYDNYGIFRTNKFYLDTDWDGQADIVKPYGKLGDIPVTGDWNGDGMTNYGIYRNGKFFIDTDWDGQADIVKPYGKLGDTPVTGNWDGI